jgi:predicted Zn-dependent protease
MLNNNFTELVKKYDTYRGNIRRKKLLSLLGLTALIAGGFFFISKSEFIINSFKKTSPETEITTPVVEKMPKKEVVVAKEEIVKEVKTEPVKRTKVETPKEKELPNKVYKRAEKKIKKDTPFKLEVQERKSLFTLLSKNKEEDNYHSTINIAKFYFEEKNYEKAVTWAVKASKKDPKQSKPWVIYAKSKAALGKVKVAKKALSLYLKHTNSPEVQKLLENIK